MIEIKPQAFFFDFDGVLCDSEKVHMFAALKALKTHEIAFTEDYYFAKLLGFDDRRLFKFVFADKRKKKLDKTTLKKLLREKNLAFMDQIESHIIYFDGVIDFVKSLHAKKIPLAIVSGALSKEVDACLKKADLAGCFLFTVCADHVTHSKPDPEPYEKAYQKMGDFVADLEPENCWVLEDSPAGILSAKDAGLKTIGITNSRPKEDLVLADSIVDHCREITVK